MVLLPLLRLINYYEPAEGEGGKEGVVDPVLTSLQKGREGGREGVVDPSSPPCMPPVELAIAAHLW